MPLWASYRIPWNTEEISQPGKTINLCLIHEGWTSVAKLEIKLSCWLMVCTMSSHSWPLSSSQPPVYGLPKPPVISLSSLPSPSAPCHLFQPLIISLSSCHVSQPRPCHLSELPAISFSSLLSFSTPCHLSQPPVIFLELPAISLSSLPPLSTPCHLSQPPVISLAPLSSPSRHLSSLSAPCHLSQAPLSSLLATCHFSRVPCHPLSLLSFLPSLLRLILSGRG